MLTKIRGKLLTRPCERRAQGGGAECGANRVNRPLNSLRLSVAGGEPLGRRMCTHTHFNYTAMKKNTVFSTFAWFETVQLYGSALWAT